MQKFGKSVEKSKNRQLGRKNKPTYNSLRSKGQDLDY